MESTHISKIIALITSKAVIASEAKQPGSRRALRPLDPRVASLLAMTPVIQTDLIPL
jgi:hypothetical protein